MGVRHQFLVIHVAGVHPRSARTYLVQVKRSSGIVKFEQDGDKIHRIATGTSGDGSAIKRKTVYSSPE